jgi:hypothetical protein
MNSTQFYYSLVGLGLGLVSLGLTALALVWRIPKLLAASLVAAMVAMIALVIGYVR